MVDKRHRCLIVSMEDTTVDKYDTHPNSRFQIFNTTSYEATGEIKFSRSLLFIDLVERRSYLTLGDSMSLSSPSFFHVSPLWIVVFLLIGFLPDTPSDWETLPNHHGIAALLKPITVLGSHIMNINMRRHSNCACTLAIDTMYEVESPRCWPSFPEVFDKSDLSS
jgi:hypothetical protein